MTAASQDNHDLGAALLPMSLTSTIRAVGPYVDSALVGVQARRAVARVTDRIPAALTRRLYFECRLRPGADRVDLVFCIDRASSRLLTGPERRWLPAEQRDHPVWKGVAALCEEWASPSSLGQGIYDLWLEFDVDDVAVARASLVPCVFIGLRRRSGRSARDSWAIAVDCLERLTGQAVPRQTTQSGQRVVERLPSSAHLPYAGLMYTRNDSTIRLCLSPLPGRELVDYLRLVEWPGSVDQIEALLHSLPCGDGETAFDRVTLVHLDVRDGVQPRLGLEIPLDQYPQIVTGIVERELLDALCQQELCAREKRDALLQWPGHTRETFPHQLWPSLALRRVSHIKLIIDAGRVEAKTYLSYFHDLARRRMRVPA